MSCFVGLSLLALPLVALAFIFIVLPRCCPRRLKRAVSGWGLRMLLPFRYEVRVRGLSSLPKDQGILFMPNHPALMDPFIMISVLTKRFNIRPVAAEKQIEKSPRLFGIVDSMPVPDFQEDGMNSYQLHRMNELLDDIVTNLENRQNILLYPAGRLMRTGDPYVELGNSAAFDVLSRRKNDKPWRVVLVRIHGMWGSRFSYAIDGRKGPQFFPALKEGIWDLLCSFMLFMPKRHVDVKLEEVLVPDFDNKVDLNNWLQSWYRDQAEAEKLPKPGDSNYVRGKGLVPTRCCRPKSFKEPLSQETTASDVMDSFDPKLVATVQTKLALHLGVSKDALGLDQNLTFDLGLDSIQIGELIGWIDVEFNVQDVEFTELTDVASVVKICSGERSSSGKSQGRRAPKGWFEGKRPDVMKEVQGKNVPEAFIRNAKRMGKAIAVGDDNSGALGYDRVLIGAMLFANFLIAHPELRAGGRVGVMMPAAAGVGVMLMGILMAGCVPVMVNWTVGRASLEHVVKSTGVKTVITAKAFLKKLGSEVDLSLLLQTKGLLLFTEDLKANQFGGFGLRDKISAKRLSGKSADTIVKRYKLENISSKDEAVVLFTSGSESLPKGVALSHGNVLANAEGIMDAAAIRADDVLLGTLPPFHSFGFTVTTITPLVTGFKISYYPKPTDYRRIAREIQRWKPTIFLGTPTFLSGVLRAAEADYLKLAESQDAKPASAKQVVPEGGRPLWPTASLRLCIAGAEKTPEDLFQLAASQHNPPITLCEGYGITETAPVLTVNRFDKPRAGVGYALKGITLALLETEAYLAKKVDVIAVCKDEKVEGPTNTRGIIIAHGPNVFGDPDATPPKGYLGVPLSEKNPFVRYDDKWWYDTGDLGFFDEQGALHLAGRLKRFIKIAGEMISLPALEAALKLHQPWADSESGPVIAVEAYEPDGGEKPILGVVSAVDCSLEEANEKLQAAGMPRIAKLTLLVDSREVFEERWKVQGTVPLLGTGKTDYASAKKAVADRYKAKRG
eukprot:TRINITY_DN36802_c1_g1_i1.p1 TRINITY_DN36802_c1_g1~~TRINITY_DN36802_c1_g1_i1.p1  ORF type:complete len:1013 (+),score=184.49 TRINITY_DN36802_c1_g1_i1:82-3120(+)